MDVIKNYKSYQKFLPEYDAWRDQQDLEREKRLEYLKKNPDKINSVDVQRGKILLHAIDVMDEYSQSYAEDMEVATEFATGQIVGFATMCGMLLGAPLAGLKSVKKLAAKISKNVHGAGMIVSMLPSVIGMLIGTAASFPAIIWATKVQVGASRKGRFEAMRTDLKNPAIFAVLTPEQMEKAKNDAKSIQLDEKEKKRFEKNSGMELNPMGTFKTLKKYYSKGGEYEKQKAEFDNKLKQNEKLFDKVQLNEEQIRNAKRDQQILADMVRRIDVASQDYAENAELATNTLTSLALGTGGLVGWISSKLLKLMKVKGGAAAKVIPWVVGASIPVIMSIYAAKVQKQASRVGRFKVKQEMMNNPASLVYVDDKITGSMNGVKLPPRSEKPNIFKFFIQLVKDNKAYNQYKKTELFEHLKFNKAVANLELSPEQIKDAKTLQMNVFKTFNKVDEKSQAYSESVEAMGQMTQQGVSMFGSLAAMGISSALMLKMLKNMDKIAKPSLGSIFVKAFAPFLLVILPVIGIDIYTTKEQKKASRVADMLALKELEDYRHYADYSEEAKSQPAKVSSNSVKSSEQKFNGNLLKKYHN